MGRITLFEDEWLMLVDLVDGLIPHCTGQEDLDFAIEGLLETRLARRTAEGVRATELGCRFRVAEPPWVEGAGRVWFIPDDTVDARSGWGSKSEIGPLA